MKAKSERLYCVAVLQNILQQKGSLAALSHRNPEASSQLNLSLIHEICYGVCRHYYALHYICTSLLKKPLRKKDNDIHCLILIGLYQLLYMRTPSHAAINETVEEASALNKQWAKALINAVLREAQRNKLDFEEKINADFSLKFSHPNWLISALKHNWPKHYQQVLLANNVQAPMTLRVNLSKTTRNDYLLLLSHKEIPAKAGLLTTTAIILEQPFSVHDLPGFEDGLISIQDEASQLAATLLQLEPSQRVLDACAAPGGKTCAILERQPDIQELVALDCDEKRLSRVKENLDRIKLQATLCHADLNKIKQWWDGQQFDRILLDVPCSGTGVIRRHPDIKLLRQETDIELLNHKQKEILQNAWALLKPGGILLYSTCSVLLSENSDQIKQFVDSSPSIKHLVIDQKWGLTCEYGRQLLPEAGNHDGFYYALLQKC